MGLLDFLQTPQGQALASGVATYAATARRGTPVNNIGRGLMGGVAGYSNAIQSRRDAEIQKQKDEYNRKQQELLGFEYDTRRIAAEDKLAERKRKAAETQAEGKQALNFYTKAFPDRKFNVVYDDIGDYQIMPVAGSIGMDDQGNFLPEAAIDAATGYNKEQNKLPGGYAPSLPPKKLYNENIARFYGFDDQQMLGLRDVMESMPDVAPAHLKDAFKANLKRRNGTSGPKETNDIANFEYAKRNGYTGSFADFMVLKSEASANAMYPFRMMDAESQRRKDDYTLPPAPQQQKSFSVKAPDGTTHTFPSQEAANAFTRAIRGAK
jgi:hypothetical protein